MYKHNLSRMLSAAMLLIGCAHNTKDEVIVESCHEYTVYIEDSFTEKRQAMIQQAGTRWADLTTSIHLKFEVVSIERIRAVQYSYGSIVVINAKVNPDMWGWTSWDSNWAYITVPNDYGRRFFLATATHEFGHAFHILDDDKNLTSIMNAGYDITCADIDQFCALWECRTPLICEPN